MREQWKEALKENGASQSAILRKFVKEYIEKTNKDRK